MRKIIILTPVYNDWSSLEKLIFETNNIIKKINNFSFDLIVINDASTLPKPKIKKPNNFESFKILNMKKNRGHARCNAFGIRYIEQNEEFDYVILMDGDGEDKPEEISSLVEKIKKTPEISFVARRIKRSEGPFFQLLYSLHKLLTFLFTGKNINFGNYSCLHKNDISKISSKASLWSSYSGTIEKYLKKKGSIKSIRGLRYFGPSQMSFYKLIIHSFSIIAVFKYQVLFRSLIIVIGLHFLEKYLGMISFVLQIIVAVFTIFIFVVSLREKKKDLLSCQENLENVEEVTHLKVSNIV